MIYFEDLVVGRETEFGSYEVTREEVLEFARKYDPQPFHIDESAGESSFFKGLAQTLGVASALGWLLFAAALLLTLVNARMLRRIR